MLPPIPSTFTATSLRPIPVHEYRLAATRTGPFIYAAQAPSRWEQARREAQRIPLPAPGKATVKGTERTFSVVERPTDPAHVQALGDTAQVVDELLSGNQWHWHSN